MPLSATTTKRRSIPYISILLFVFSLLSGCTNSSGTNGAGRDPVTETSKGAKSAVPTGNDLQLQGQLAPTPVINGGTVHSGDTANSGHYSSSGRVVTLAITINGFESADGECRIAIYGDAKSFNKPDKALFKEVVRIEENGSRWKGTIELPQGLESIAVAAYHDRNSNEMLDKNSFGIPTERYGFSNDPKRGFGPPKFLETSVPISEDSLELEISVR